MLFPECTWGKSASCHRNTVALNSIDEYGPALLLCFGPVQSKMQTKLKEPIL